MINTYRHKNRTWRLVLKGVLLGAWAVGSLVLRLFPNYSARLLTTWPQGGPTTRVPRLVYNAVRQRVLWEYYANKSTSSRREALKDLCMSKQSGVEMAGKFNTLGFPEEDFYPRMFDVLDDRLSNGKVKSVHQVACSSGREIAYYAKRYPQVEFIGSDMDEMIVEDCRNRYIHIPNLSFELVRLDRLDDQEQHRLKCDLIFGSQGLQYLDQSSLTRCFMILLPLTRTLLIGDSLAVDYDMSKQHHSSPRGNFSWNHPYSYYLAETGWKDIRYDFTFVEAGPWAKIVNVSAESDTCC